MDTVVRPVGHVHEIIQILEVNTFENIVNLLFQLAVRHAVVSREWPAERSHQPPA
jgi:hypothetical protein